MGRHFASKLLNFVVRVICVSQLALCGTVAPSQAHAQEKAPAKAAEKTAQETAEKDAAVAVSEVFGKIQYQPHIYEILTAHCAECHGIKQSKGGMRVDDRETLLSYIAPGDLASSSLWNDYLVTSDPEMHMPPFKHGNALSALELAAIRVWIEDGAEWPEGLTNVPNAASTAASVAQKNLLQKMWTFVGYFHPAVVHFPIGLLLISSLFIVLAFVKRETFEPAAFHCLWIGAAGAIVASFAGWAFADIRGYGDFWSTHWSSDPIARHRISGLGVTGFAIALSIVAFIARRRTSSDMRLVWLGGALCLAGLVSLVGHQGGELTYGEELFSRAYEHAFGK